MAIFYLFGLQLCNCEVANKKGKEDVKVLLYLPKLGHAAKPKRRLKKTNWCVIWTQSQGSSKMHKHKSKLFRIRVWVSMMITLPRVTITYNAKS